MSQVHKPTIVSRAQIATLVAVFGFAVVATLNAEEEANLIDKDSAYLIALDEMTSMLRLSQSKYHGALVFVPQSPVTETHRAGMLPQPTVRRVSWASRQKARDYRCGYMDGWATAMTRVRAVITVSGPDASNDGRRVQTRIDRVHVHASGQLAATTEEYLEGVRDGRERFERFVDEIENEFATKTEEIERAVVAAEGYQGLLPHYGALVILQSLHSADSGNVAQVGTLGK